MVTFNYRHEDTGEYQESRYHQLLELEDGFGDDIVLLIKYKNGRDLDPLDECCVREWCSIGMMKTGISLQRKVITAKTIGLGLKLIGEV